MPFIKNVAIFAKKVIAAIPEEYTILSAGGFFTGTSQNQSLFISGSGRAWSWGSDQNGQLGINSLNINRETPVSVLGLAKTFCHISAGEGHSLAIDKNGRAWGWGSNGSGRLGDGTTTIRQTPVLVGGVRTFCRISGGNAFTIAIDKNGRAWGWGINSFGEVGNNTILSQVNAVSVLGAVKTFCRISAGGSHSLAIDKNGTVWGWGIGANGQLGNNSSVSRLTPVSVAGVTKTFCKIDGGYTHSLAIDKNGRVWSWGSNSNGKLGDNSITQRTTPVSVLGAVKTFCHISAGGEHSLAIDKNGRAWSWGFNEDGALGDNTLTSRRTPVSVAGTVKTFCHISAGGAFSLAVDKNGRVWAWGRNAAGNLGNNFIFAPKTPTSIYGNKTFSHISAGKAEQTSHGIDKNGRVWGWGRNNNGQIGNNSTTNEQTPVSILGAVKTFCQISESGDHVLVIDKNGRAWAWGRNAVGQLGNNDFTLASQRTPVSVGGVARTFCKITAGNTHSLAIDKNGRAWAWGEGTNGRLGGNSTASRIAPFCVCGVTKTFCEIFAGNSHSVAIEKNGQVWSWGNNSFGQLGDNSITSQLTPVSILGAVKTFCKISAFLHTLAIDKNGRAWSWGYNANAQLGDGSTISRLTPVSVAGAVKTFCEISAGGQHSVAIDKNGRVWGWGNNANGQLGNNSTSAAFTPVSVFGITKTFCKIFAGQSSTLAIDKNGGVWAWGANTFGAIGIYSIFRTPVQVCKL